MIPSPDTFRTLVTAGARERGGAGHQLDDSGYDGPLQRLREMTHEVEPLVVAQQFERKIHALVLQDRLLVVAPRDRRVKGHLVVIAEPRVRVIVHRGGDHRRQEVALAGDGAVREEPLRADDGRQAAQDVRCVDVVVVGVGRLVATHEKQTHVMSIMRAAG